jgi:hypothetical protein
MERIEILGSVQFMELLDHVAALGCPKNMNPSGCSWARGFAAAAARGDDAIREAASRYTNALPPETLALMQGVRAHKMIGILKSMPGNIEINRQMKNAEIENVSVGYLIKGPYDFSENYLPFLALIRKLENVLPPAILDATHNGL